MCELSYKHKRLFDLEFFTSASEMQMSKQQFDELVCKLCLEMEVKANCSGDVRCHIHERETEASGLEKLQSDAACWKVVTESRLNEINKLLSKVERMEKIISKQRARLKESKRERWK